MVKILSKKHKKGLIALELKGGLGNQLFQYAAAFSLCKRTNQNLVILLDWFDIDNNYGNSRKFELDHFNITSTKAKQKSLKFKSLIRILGGSINASLKTYKEPSFFYDQNIFKQRNIILDGYWQSEKYFIGCEDLIRKEFTFKKRLLNKSKKYYDLIDRANCSVSLHIRRGDYVDREIVKDFHGVVSHEYYDKAIELMASKFENLHIFIFSDDIDWCKENLNIKYDHTFIENTEPIEDIRLMTICNHNVIANSTFSWWGAWLNPNPSKIVIAPKKWFNNSLINIMDLIPKEWTRL